MHFKTVGNVPDSAFRHPTGGSRGSGIVALPVIDFVLYMETMCYISSFKDRGCLNLHRYARILDKEKQYNFEWVTEVIYT